MRRRNPFQSTSRARHWRHAGQRAGIRPSAEQLEPRELLAVTPGTWQELSNSIPDANGGQTMMLLSDGTVMVQAAPGSSVSNNFYQLTPTSTGNYASGTWSQLSSSNVARLYAPMTMLQNGNVFMIGGEYSTPYDFTNSSEIYNPTAGSGGTWTSTASIPTPPTSAGDNPPPSDESQFGDDPIETLPNGSILAGYFDGPQTYVYTPSTNTWTQTGDKLRGDRSDEETWIKLADGSILSYDVFASETDGKFEAQRYIPSTGTWVDASTLSATNPPSLLTGDNQGAELGPGFLLPNGQVMLFGANGNTAIYTPSASGGTWSAGPAEPELPLTITDDANGNGVVTDGGSLTPLVAADAPGAMLPNGDILIALSPLGGLNLSGTYDFPQRGYIYEYDPVDQTFTDVTPTNLNLANNSVFSTDMLVLPSGQVMLTNQTGTIDVYTPVGSPQDSWRPQITSVVGNGNGTFVLTGTQLTGISEVHLYGDDNEMASNYPLVQLTDSAGNVTYLRTSNWSSTGVAQGSTPQTVDFSVPAGFVPGTYTMVVIANGISSLPQDVDLGAPTAIDDSAETAANQPVTIDVLANDITNLYTIDPTSVKIVTPPGAGAVQVNPVTGVVTYTPSTGFYGTDTFQYTVADTHGLVSNVATVTIMVDPPPVAANDVASTQPGVPVTIDVTANDHATNATIVPASLKIVTQPLDGTVQLVGGKVVYTPAAGYVGGDSFQYTVDDSNGNVSNVGTAAVRTGGAVEISGVAYVDGNDDGVQDAGEVGIPGVMLELTKTDGNYTFTTFTLTGPNGVYHFVEGANYIMPAGTYTVKEIQPGFFVPGRASNGTPAAVGPNTSSQFAGITLAVGQQGTGYDFGSQGLAAPFVSAYYNRRAFMASTGPDFTGLDLANGVNWFSFDAGVDGTLTAVAQFDPALGNVTLTLLNSAMNAVATSASSGGQAELSFSGQATGPYFLEVSGTNTNVTLHTYAPGPQVSSPPPVQPQYHNASNPLDVNGDGIVSALDALQIINDLNANEVGPLSALTGLGTGMVDVNDDGQLTALDALDIINDLNSAAAAALASPAVASAAVDSVLAAPAAAGAGSVSPTLTSNATDDGSLAFALAAAPLPASTATAGSAAASPASGPAAGSPTGAAASHTNPATATSGAGAGGGSRPAATPNRNNVTAADALWSNEDGWLV